MFDLDAAVREWRTSQEAVGESIGDDSINELESHLREQFEELNGISTLTSQEAFLLAKSRLGDGATLEREFAKMHELKKWARRLFWMIAGYLVLNFVLVLATTIGRISSAIFSSMNIPILATSALAIGVVGCLLGVVLWCANRFDDSDGSLLSRVAHAQPTIFVLIVVSALFVGNFVLGVGADSVGYSPSAETTSAIAYSTFSIQLAFSAVLAVSMILLLRRHVLPPSHTDRRIKVNSKYLVGSIACLSLAAFSALWFLGFFASTFSEVSGRPIERIGLVDMEGKLRSFDELEGGSSVLYFWTSWCAPCAKSLASVQRIHDDGGMEIRFVAVALDGDMRGIENMLSKANFQLGTWLSKGGSLPLQQRKFGNELRAVPYVVRLDDDTHVIESAYFEGSLERWKSVLVGGSSLQSASKLGQL